MIEETNEESINSMLMDIPFGLSAVERLVLCNQSTVQTLLSVIFNIPIEVVVINQIELSKNVFMRWSKLVAKDKTVCLAQSWITTDNEGFANGIKEMKMGIGQLISAKDLITRRIIKKFYSDNTVFSRIYQIGDVGMTQHGSHINCLITEVFPKKVFADACFEWNNSVINNHKKEVL